MNNQSDPLALASETPDVAALIEEFEIALQNGPCDPTAIQRAEDTRYNRWSGKSNPPDGCKWQRNQPQGKIARPYDGAPDTDVNLTDEICAAEVDIDITALYQARIGADTTHVTALTAAQVAELAAVGRWIQKVTKKDCKRGAELLAQMKAELGWAVLNPGWCERYGLVTRRISLNDLIEEAAQAEDGSLMKQLPMLILDPEQEEKAVEIALALFPHLKKAKARQIVRELRGPDQATEFVDKELEERRPYLRVLIPGYNFFVSGGTDDLQKIRGALIIERFYEADLRSTAASNGWNEDFVEAVVQTAGQFSVFGERMRDQSITTDARDRAIEIWTVKVRQVDPDTGAAGIYCTTLSPHLNPGQGAAGNGPTAGGGRDASRWYAKHYLLDYAHGQYPFCQAEREVTGPALDDSRGIPEMVRSDQKVIKLHQDALGVRAQLEVNPPRLKLGSGWTKIKDEWGPGAEITAQPGADMKYVGVDRGNPQVAIEYKREIEQGTRRRFALPNNGDNGDHPALWQMRQMRNARRWLACWEEAFWQLAVLCYQELSAEELAEIIGRWPQLTVKDLLRHQITLTFDARSLDQDWTKTVLDFVGQLLMWDNGGLMDRGPILQLGLSYIDPTIVTGIMRNPAGASAALYRQVEQDIASIMDFNPPPLREMDPSAGMQLQMAFAVIGKNPKYQMLLKNMPMIQENFKTYVNNLEHSQQETQISPVQGRLGVSAQPQKPVEQGAPTPGGVAMIGNGY